MKNKAIKFMNAMQYITETGQHVWQQGWEYRLNDTSIQISYNREWHDAYLTVDIINGNWYKDGRGLS